MEHTDQGRKTKILNDIQNISSHLTAYLLHLRPPNPPAKSVDRLPCSLTPLYGADGGDDATVVTSNTTRSDTSWSLISSRATCATSQCHSAAASRPPLPHTNYYDVLGYSTDKDDDSYNASSICVNSGASDNFGNVTTPGTNRHMVPTGVTMASATSDCKTSVGKDAFALPLPPLSLDFHVFKRDEVQRPLLSVGKVCDAGCSVLFTGGHCYFFKDRRLLLKGACDFSTGLYLLPRVPCTPKLTYGLNLSRPYHTRAHDAYTIPKLMSYLHGCAGYPVTSTWIQAILHGMARPHYL